MRILHEHPLLPATDRGSAFEVEVDGEKLFAYPGETIAAVLAANGKRVFYRSENDRSPRGLYCGIGLCFACLVTVNGVSGVRACLTLAEPGMHILTAEGMGQCHES